LVKDKQITISNKQQEEQLFCPFPVLKSEKIIMLWVRTSYGDLHGELGVAEDGEQSRDAGDDVGQDDGGAGVFAGLEAGEDEDAGADDRADAEPHEVPPVERLLHLVLASSLDLNELRVVQGAGHDPILQPHRGLHQRLPVVAPAPKRFLGQKIALCARAPPPSNPFIAAVHSSHSALITTTQNMRSGKETSR
jgi:hypothetical protein